MKSTTLLVGTTIAALAIASWTALIAAKRSSEATIRSRAEQAEMEVAKLNAELGILRERLDHMAALGAQDAGRRIKADPRISKNPRLPRPIGALSHHPLARSHSVEPAHDDDNRCNGEGAAAGNQPTREVITDLLEDSFFSERYDTSWAGKEEEKLHSMFTEANPEGNHLLEASCRSSLCRIEVLHDDTEAEERFIRAFAASAKLLNDDKRAFYHMVSDEDGDQRTVLFYARREFELPRTNSQ